MTETELAWLAGLLEGEGTFTINYVKGKSDQPCIEVKMVDLDVIERACALMGRVSVYARKPDQTGHQIQYRVRLRGKRAAHLMRQLLPHMGKRRQARIREILG
jgi:hypothetical protein